jgi:cell fate (sporulation/competence/biofilm development) regulator YlbF (YheA/YmcA/DUF963 family)
MSQSIVGEQIVIGKARDLARALGESQGFRDYERALEHYRQDLAAADLLEEAHRLEAETSTQVMLWGDSGDDRSEVLASLRQRLLMNPAIQALQQAEDRLAALLFGVVLRLTDMTGIDYAEACTGRKLSGCGPAPPPEEFAAGLRESPEISAAVETLGRSIQEAEAFQRFEVARRNFQNDAGVVHIRNQVKAAVATYIEAERNGALTQDLIQDVRSAQSRLREHAIVQEFSKRRQDIHDVFKNVNQAIAEILGIDIARMVAPATGCCG